MTHDVDNFAQKIRGATSHIKHPAAKEITDKTIELYATIHTHITARVRPAIAASALGTFGDELATQIEQLIAEFR